MKATAIQRAPGLSRLKSFLALSRTPHAVLDMASPALAALLWLGELPSARITALGLGTALAGYLAVYALNDLVGFSADQKKIRAARHPGSASDLDAILVIHPMAHGLLSYGEGLLWTVAWGALALIGSALLNPVCTVIFLLACLLEVIYCLLLRVTSLRGAISGIVKNSGGIAAVFAVAPAPSPLFLAFLFAWFFFWEIGGQNIPNDWADLEEDRSLGAKTLPVRFGPFFSLRMIHFALLGVVSLSVAIFWVVPWGLGLLYLPGAIAAGYLLLLQPARRLHRARTPSESFALFNRASYYPLAMLGVTVVSIATRG